MRSRLGIGFCCFLISTFAGMFFTSQPASAMSCPTLVAPTALHRVWTANQNMSSLVPAPTAIQQINENPSFQTKARLPTLAEKERMIQLGFLGNRKNIERYGVILQSNGIDFEMPGEAGFLESSLKLRKWNEGLDFLEMEKRLKGAAQTERVILNIPMNKFLRLTGLGVGGMDISKKTNLIVFSSGLSAVFKTGSRLGFAGEVAGYRVSQRLLQDRLVPPTVFATINGELGSLQYYVPPAPSNIASQLVSEEDKNRREVFYGVSGNWDKNLNNQSID
ncbi:MAG: hypothetical protein K2X47_16215, partial [Bdellovibrionales bacterium]|nr:hypothetical protein [Bdellovibrionales bacterium]